MYLSRPWIRKPPTPQLSDEPVNDEISAWWLLHERSGNDAIDISRNGNDGIGQNNPATAVSSIGYARTFNGSNQYLNIGKMRDFGSRSGICTLVFKIKWTSTGVAVVYGIQWNGTPGCKHIIYLNAGVTSGGSGHATAGDIKFWWSTGSGQDFIQGTDGMGLNDGVEHVFVLSIDSAATTASLHVDGVTQTLTTQTGYGAGTGTFVDYDYDATIGAYNVLGVSQNYFSGDVIDFRVWPRILRDEEKAILFRRPLAGLKRRRVWIPKKSGAVVSVGLSVETDVAFSIGALKTKSTGLSSETDSAFAVGASKAKSIGLGTEINTALSVSSMKSWSVNLATETDSAFAVSINRAVAVGIAQEASTAFAIDTLKAWTIGLATEMDTAFSITLPAVFVTGCKSWEIDSRSVAWDTKTRPASWYIEDRPVRWS